MPLLDPLPPSRPGAPPVRFDAASAARRAVAHSIKIRARRYARCPQTLDALHPGLGRAPAATLLAIAQHLVERESASPRRWFGFGGEVTLVNARAALLLGRAMCRAERSGTMSRRPRFAGPTGVGDPT